MTRRANRVDACHAEIRDGLRAEGWDVLDMSAIGGGIPDLMVNIIPGLSLGLELKRPGIRLPTKALTAGQKQYYWYMSQTTRVVQTLEQAHLECINAAKTWRSLDE